MLPYPCQQCGKQVSVDSLADIEKHVRKCSKAKPKEKEKEKVPRAKSTGELTLPIDIKCSRSVLSQNAFKGSHRWVYIKDARGWKEHLTPLLITAGLTSRQFEWSSWLLCRYYDGRAREFDYGNLVGGAKPVPDALIEHGVIVDDTPAHFTCEYRQERGQPGTLLRLLEHR